jgi:predicted metalloendopeptidase
MARRDLPARRQDERRRADRPRSEVRRDDFAGNALRAAAFETHRELARAGQPVDRGELAGTPMRPAKRCTVW